VLPYQRDASESVLKLLHNVAKRTDKEKRKLANQVGCDVNHAAIVDGFSQGAMLRAAAPAITNLWLIDIIDRAVDPPVPNIRNTEGEKLLFCAIHFPLAADATADDIRLALSRCPALRQESTTFWNWLAPRQPAEALPRQTETSQSHTFATTLDDGSLVLGEVELKGKTLILSVNSQGRANRGRALLSEVLSGLVGEPLVEMQTLNQVMASRRDSPPPPET
jgi:hypothetical protein